jgi:hypothetical protein
MLLRLMFTTNTLEQIHVEEHARLANLLILILLINARNVVLNVLIVLIIQENVLIKLHVVLVFIFFQQTIVV